MVYYGDESGISCSTPPSLHIQRLSKVDSRFGFQKLIHVLFGPDCDWHPSRGLPNTSGQYESISLIFKLSNCALVTGYIHKHLVGGFTHLENINQWEGLSHILWEKHV